jgi:hypothetical protein
MSTESVMPRLRGANPVREPRATFDGDLFARIVSRPGDARVGRVRRGSADRRGRGSAFVIALAVAALLASTAYAVSRLIGSDFVRPPVTKHEYVAAQRQLELPPGYGWPAYHLPPGNTVTSRGGGAGHAVLIAQNAWECYWVVAIRRRDASAASRAHSELERLLAQNVVVAPVGAPEGWTPTPPPTHPFVVFAHDGGLNWVRASYAEAAAGDDRNLSQSCRANAPAGAP